MLKELDIHLEALNIKSPRLKSLLGNKTTLRNLSKNENVFVEGDSNKMEYMLIRGVLHRYNISDKGKLVTTGFYTAANVITPHCVRVKEGRSIFSLQALTDSILLEIPACELTQLLFSDTEFYVFAQDIIQAEMSKLFLFEAVYRSYSARERILFFREHYPNLENSIPHSIIASFLGITNVSFSRLRHVLSIR